MTRRWRLFPKYALLIITLVGSMLVASGAIGLTQRAGVGRFSAEWLHADVIIGHEVRRVNESRIFTDLGDGSYFLARPGEGA